MQYHNIYESPLGLPFFNQAVDDICDICEVVKHSLFWVNFNQHVFVRREGHAYESLLNLCFITTSHTVFIDMECAMLVNIIFLLHVIIIKLSYALSLLHK